MGNIGLKGHVVASVYAVFNQNHKRGTSPEHSWNNCEFVGITRNLEEALQSLLLSHEPDIVSHARVMSYPYPQKAAMQELANKWIQMSKDAGGNAASVVIMESEVWDTEQALNLDNEQNKLELRRALDSVQYLHD